MTKSLKIAALTGTAAFACWSSAVSAQDAADSAAILPAGSASTSSSSFRLSAGVSYSKGDYGEIEDTEVFAVPVSLTYRSGDLKIRVSVPFVQVTGPGSLLSTPEGRDGGGSGQGRGRGRGGDSGNSGSGSSSSGSGSGGSEIEVEDEIEDEVVDDDDVVDGGGFAAADNTRSGIGDVSIAVTYSLELVEGTYFEPTARLKLPTASREKRLGSGEVDVTIGADLVQEMGAVTVYAGGFRKFAGKPEGSTIRSVWGAGVGASARVANGFSLGGDFSWQESAFAGRQASAEVTAWANTRLSRALSLTIYGGTGLNTNSADLFGGASVSMRF